MQGGNQVYHLKVDTSGRIVLPADMRSRHHITQGDTIVVVDDEAGIRITTQERALAEVRAYCATLAPANVLLSEELLNDRRSDVERD